MELGYTILNFREAQIRIFENFVSECRFMLVHYVHKDSLVCGGARQSYIEVYLPIVVGGWRGKHNSILLHTLFYSLRVQSIRICALV